MGHLRIITDQWLFHFVPGEEVSIPCDIRNENDYPINFADTFHHLSFLGIVNFKKDNQAIFNVDFDKLSDQLLSGESVHLMLHFIVPNEKGRSKMAVALKVDALPPTYQSNWMRIMIGE